MRDGLEQLAPQDAVTIRRLLTITARSAATMTGAELREARHAAGLSLGQAAKLLNIMWESLMVIEREPDGVGYEGEMASRLWQAMDRVYGLAQPAKDVT